MKEYKLNVMNQIFNTVSDGNLSKMAEIFWEESDGPIVAYFVHVSGNGNRLFLFKNSLALLSAQKIYKFDLKNLDVELKQESFLKGIFVGSHTIHLKDKDTQPDAKPVSFNVGRIMVSNGVQGTYFEKHATIAFAPFLSNLKTLLPTLGGDFEVNFILTGEMNEKGDLKFKPYHLCACQELLILDRDYLYIVNEQKVSLKNDEIDSIEIFKKKKFLGEDTFIKITSKNGDSFYVATYNAGFPDTKRTESLLEKLENQIKTRHR